MPLSGACGRRIGRGFHTGTVAGSQGPYQGFEGEQHGVVPGRHDERHTVGVVPHLREGGEVGQRRPAETGACPAAQVAAHVAYLGERESHLTHVSLRGRLAQVAVHGLQQLGLVLLYGATELVQGLKTETDGQGGSRAEEVALLGDGLCYVCHTLGCCSVFLNIFKNLGNSEICSASYFIAFI